MASLLEAFPGGVGGALAWSRAVADTVPLSWALWPVRASLDAAFAPSAGAFWAALPGALLVLAAHAAWVYASDAAFEEAALESARKLSARRAALQAGAVMARPRRDRQSYALSSRGPPGVALAWKALVRARRVVSIPAVAGAAVLALAAAMVPALTRRDGGPSVAALIALVAVIGHGAVVFFGPFLFNGDLRRDTPSLDLLRALPLRGRDVLAGEMAVPLAHTAAAQWALALLFLALAGEPFPADPWERVGVAAALAIGGPAISAVLYLVVNGLAVLYPEWVGAAAGGASPLDHLGARTLVALATLVLGALGLAAPIVAGVLAAALTWDVLGVWALTLGALAGAALVALEAAVALRALGRAFERIDLST